MTKNLHELSRFLDKMHKSGFVIANQVYLCAQSNVPAFTGFLDPARSAAALSALANLPQFGIAMAQDGGYPAAERAMLGFFPAGGDKPNFPIAKIAIEYEAKHTNLSHSDFLGAILGLGLDRAIIGDIVMLPEAAVVMAQEHMADFLLGSLHKVGRAGVAPRLVAPDEDFYGLDNRVADRLICASLRLDNVLAAAFKLSRGDAAALVKSGRAFVNWQETKSPSKPLKERDMLTLRKFGRVQIKALAGKSKKDHFLIDIVKF